MYSSRNPSFLGSEPGCLQGPRRCLSYYGGSVRRTRAPEAPAEPLLAPLRSLPLPRSPAGTWGGLAHRRPEKPKGNAAQMARSTRTCSCSPLFTTSEWCPSPGNPLCPQREPQNHLQVIRLELNKVSILNFHLSRSKLQQGLHAQHHWSDTLTPFTTDNMEPFHSWYNL